MKIYYDPNEKEVWKPILWSRGYWISSFGNIGRRKSKSKEWILLKPCYSKIPHKEYARIGIKSKDGSFKLYSVHRLVANEFRVNPNLLERNQINHLDGNPKNNHWRNLQWCTNKMNMNHSTKVLNRRPKGKDSALGLMNRKLTEEQVKKVPELMLTKSITDIAKDFGVGITTITELISGRSWEWLNLKFPKIDLKNSVGYKQRLVPILGYNNKGDIIAIYSSVSESENYGLSSSAIDVLLYDGKNRIYKGLHWRKATEEEVNRYTDRLNCISFKNCTNHIIIQSKNGQIIKLFKSLNSLGNPLSNRIGKKLNKKGNSNFITDKGFDWYYLADWPNGEELVKVLSI